MRPVNAILALLTAVAGWHYLFYSRSASRLTAVESPAVNRQRLFLRRANGVVLLFIAILLYVGTFGVDEQVAPRLFAMIWLAVVLLLIVLMLLVLADIRFTMRLKNAIKKRPAKSSENPVDKSDER